MPTGQVRIRVLKSKYSHILVLLAAIFAFLPVMAVDFLLDSYVRVRERAHLQTAADAIASRVQANAYDTIASLRHVLADSPSLCTPTFVANIHKLMAQSLYLKQVLVENGDGVQYCDGLGQTLDYSPLSRVLSVPGHTETIEVVQYGEMGVPALKVTQAFGATRTVSAFAPVVSADPASLLAGLKPSSMVQLDLTDGAEIFGIGDRNGYDNRGNTEYLTAEAFAGELPIRVTAAVPFAIVRADYGDLDASLHGRHRTDVRSVPDPCAAICAEVGPAGFRSGARHRRRGVEAILPARDQLEDRGAGWLRGAVPVEKKNGEIVNPGMFIEYAEVTGLAIPMTLSLMQQVKTDLGELCRDLPDLKISINLFEGHFRDGGIVEDVQSIFSGSPISFRQLVFEITERQPLDKHLQANSVIAGLHALGARLAMDDAGTGHSNLAYMQTLGVDVIKIDRVFVDMIKPDTQNVPVLDGLITMARELNTEIVAEGVETEEQAIYLRGRGVIMAQGYLFAPALRAGPFRELARALNPQQPQRVSLVEAEAA